MPRKKKDPKIEKIKKPDSSMLAYPPNLYGIKVSPKALASGSYSKKVLAYLASVAIPQAMQDLMTQSAEGKTQATSKILEVYQILQTPKGLSIINDNRSVNVDARGNEIGSGPEERSFEAVARLLDETRERRLASGNPLSQGPILDITEFSPTPDRESPAKG